MQRYAMKIPSSNLSVEFNARSLNLNQWEMGRRNDHVDDDDDDEVVDDVDHVNDDDDVDVNI